MTHPIDPMMPEGLNGDGAYTVPLPCVTDLVGRTLRDIFGVTPTTPPALAELLHRLDTVN